MNEERKEQIEEAIRKLRVIKDELSGLCIEEREAYEDMPENPRSFYDKSEDIEYVLGDLYSFIVDLEFVIDDCIIDDLL